MSFFRRLFGLGNDDAPLVGDPPVIKSSGSPKPPQPAEPEEPVIEEEPVDLVALEARLNSASTIDECFEVATEAPEDSELENNALEKALTIATTPEECRRLPNEWFIGDNLSEKVSDKIVSLYNQQLREARTVDKFFEIADEAVDDMDLDESDYEIVLALANTADECGVVHDRSIDDNIEGEVVEKILLKKISFLDNVDDCQSIWDEHGVDSEPGKAAVCKAADIIRARPVAAEPPSEPVAEANSSTESQPTT